MHKNYRPLLKILLLVFISMPAHADTPENVGKVCFGKNLAKPANEHTDRIYLKINSSEKLFFNQPHTGAVVDKLNINKKHIVQVYLDGQVAQTWSLNFSKLKTKSIIIWRSAGSWRMDPANSGECE